MLTLLPPVAARPAVTRRILGALEVDSAVLTTGLKIIGTIAVAIIARALLHRTVDRFAARIAAGLPTFARSGWGRIERHVPVAGSIFGGASPAASESSGITQRRQQRAHTTASVFNSATTLFVSVVASLTILQLLALPIEPILAGAGVVGVALGFGAQALVKDVLSGIFMIVEDQYGVGDIVDLGSASGVVEAVGLRVTQVRGDDGTTWYVRNGEIPRVGNHSQGWSKLVLDVRVAHGQDLAAIEKAMASAAGSLHDDPQLSGALAEPVELLGVEALSAEGVTLRIALMVHPELKSEVSRLALRRIKETFDAEGVRLAPAVV